MHLILTNGERNLLYLILADTIEVGTAEAFFAELKKALAQLEAGFTLITDLREMKDLDEESLPTVRRVMDMFSAKGIAKVIRILATPTGNHGFTVMSYFHYSRKVPLVSCENAAQALSKLQA